MKIAIVSESPADEAAIKILVDAIVGTESELFPIRTRPYGWTNVFKLLPNIVTGLHYGTDVEALVVVVDSDEAMVLTANMDAQHGLDHGVEVGFHSKQPHQYY